MAGEPNASERRDLLGQAATFGEWIRHRREQLRYSRRRLAELIGVSESHVREMEYGNRRVSERVAGRLLDSLLIPADLRPGLMDWALRGTGPKADIAIPFTETLLDHETATVLQSIRSSETLSIRFAQEPLTCQSLSTLVGALTDLHTRCWLIQTRRLEDLERYTISRDPELVRDANLIVTRLSHNSPLDVNLSAAKDVAEAMKTGVETVALIGAQRKQAQLENRGRELDLEIKALEAEQAAARRDQDLELDRREREISLREKEVEIEQKRLDLERTRLELVQQRLEVAAHIMEAAAKLVPMLYPDASDDARPMLAQKLVPSLLQLGELAANGELTATTTSQGLPATATPEGQSGQD